MAGIIGVLGETLQTLQMSSAMSAARQHWWSYTREKTLSRVLLNGITF